MADIEQVVNDIFSDTKKELEAVHNKKGNEHKPKNKTTLILVLLVALLVLSCTILLVASTSIRINAVKDVYISAKPQAISNAYEKTGKKIYNIGEQRYHTGNDVGIKIDGIEKVSSLEALEVTDIYYYFNTGDHEVKSEAWYKITGTGIYTVNMELAEIITDEERNYILIRVPNPTLQLDDFNVTVKQFYFDKKMFEGVVVGEEVAAVAEKEGYKNIKSNILSNQDYFICAKKTAESLLINLAKQCNPGVDVNVEIEFFS